MSNNQNQSNNPSSFADMDEGQQYSTYSYNRSGHSETQYTGYHTTSTNTVNGTEVQVSQGNDGRHVGFGYDDNQQISVNPQQTQ
ncbi:uncharacterized protein I206_103626 [Kwoniella pini CBS 10737]|uniref:Uncharacterized protein n=1 Tax=Kwoniella pini CBS 10737 TaxID=1296096 RepID=A0A1B9I9E2_9TREE|nr:uncharacterized protein I206_01372 [Kwoniella pini CBS 10737]OCF52087.1 hypothetical protein I206_01372 [Kwoniella pini CBS 10737]